MASFTKKMMDYGRIQFTDSWIRLYESMYDFVPISNVPAGKIVDARWVNNHVEVKMASGRTFVYTDTGSASSFYD